MAFHNIFEITYNKYGSELLLFVCLLVCFFSWPELEVFKPEIDSV